MPLVHLLSWTWTEPLLLLGLAGRLVIQELSSVSFWLVARALLPAPRLVLAFSPWTQPVLVLLALPAS